MNVSIRQVSALAIATALAVPAVAATGLQETTTEELDRIEQATEPPPVSDIDDRMNPVDPEVDAMTQPPQVDDTTADDMDAMGDEQEPMHDDGMHDDRWATLDADGDGRVSREEGQVDADFSANFAMMDGDGDGFISQIEFEAEAGMEEQEENDDW